MDVSEDIVTRNYSGMKFDEVLEYLIQEVKARNYLITRINNIDNIHYRLNGDAAKNIKFKLYKIVEFCNLESCSQLISTDLTSCLLYTSPSPRDQRGSRMPSSA